MKRLFLLLVIVAAPAFAQTHTICAEDNACTWTGVHTFSNTVNFTGAVQQNGTSVSFAKSFAGVPSGACSGADMAVDTTSGTLYDCLSGSWTAISAGGGGGTPATPGNSIQYNNGGAFGGLYNITATKKFLSQTGDGSNPLAPSFAQPACSDISNAAASCSTDATNATNISSGTLNVGRLDLTSYNGAGGFTTGTFSSAANLPATAGAGNTYSLQGMTDCSTAIPAESTYYSSGNWNAGLNKFNFIACKDLTSKNSYTFFYHGETTTTPQVPSNEVRFAAYYNPGLIQDNLFDGTNHRISFVMRSRGINRWEIGQDGGGIEQDPNSCGAPAYTNAVSACQASDFAITQWTSSNNGALNWFSHARISFLPILETYATNAGDGTGNQTLLSGNLQNTGFVATVAPNDTTGAAAFKFQSSGANQGWLTMDASRTLRFSTLRDPTSPGTLYWKLGTDGTFINANSNIIKIDNGTTAQELQLYKTDDGAGNTEFIDTKWDNVQGWFWVGANKAGTGTVRTLALGGASSTSPGLTISNAGAVTAKSTLTSTSTFTVASSVFVVDTAGKATANGGIVINTSAAEPTCDSTKRGMYWHIQSALGVKDIDQVCAKLADDTYAWQSVAPAVTDKTCSGTDKVSAIVGGTITCSADQTTTGGTGITSLGGDTSSTQTLSTGASGNSPGWVNNGTGDHLINIPLASASGTVTAGLISNSDYTTFNNKASTSSGLGQFASTTSAQLATVLSDESGTGFVAFTTSPVFTTPSLGAASASSISTSGTITPSAAGGTTVGSSALPFSSVYVGSAATNNYQITGTATAARTLTLPDANTVTVVASSAPASEWANGIGTNGVITYTRPAASDLSNGTSGSGAVLLATSPTGVTLDAEGSGNSITTPSKIYMVAAGCNATVAAPAFDIPSSGGATAACLGTTTTAGVLVYPDAATTVATTNLALPSDWTGNVDVKLIFTGDASSTSAITWQVATGCVADAAAIASPTYNTASSSNVAGPATAGFRQSVTYSTVNVTNCAASETMYLQVERLGAGAGDAYTGNAQLLAAEVTIRRAM